MTRTTASLLTALATMLLHAPVCAQSDVGTVAAVLGTTQIEHAGVWQNTNIGVPVFVGDQIRTGATDRATVVFRDDSVIDVAPDTEIGIDSLTLDEPAHHFHASFKLAKGKVRAWVTERYQEPRARFEIETPTAIAAVHGTQFMILYDLKADYTEVLGITDEVEVIGKLGLIGTNIEVGPRMLTRVQKGRFPSTPQALDTTQFAKYLSDLEITGTGRRDGLNVLHPAVLGRILAPQDVPPGANPLAGVTSPTEAGLSIGAPGPSLAERLSQDIYANTQPLLDFKRTPPGTVPTGSVQLGF